MLDARPGAHRRSRQERRVSLGVRDDVLSAHRWEHELSIAPHAGMIGAGHRRSAREELRSKRVGVFCAGMLELQKPAAIRTDRRWIQLADFLRALLATLARFGGGNSIHACASSIRAPRSSIRATRPVALTPLAS